MGRKTGLLCAIAAFAHHAQGAPNPPVPTKMTDSKWHELRETARAEVERVCQSSAQTSGRDLAQDRERLATLVVTDVAHRKALVAHLKGHNGKGPCGDLVRAKLGSFREAFGRGQKTESYQEFRPYVLLAVTAGLPDSGEILADLSRADPDNDWLIALRSYDPDAYSRTLEMVISRIAGELRQELGLELLDPSLYGQVQQNVFSEKSVRFQNPLLLHSYLSDRVERNQAQKKEKPSSDAVIESSKWNDLNVLYAVMGIQEKTTASALFAQLIQGSDSAWIASLRKEPVWIQFRLLNLMKQVGGPEVVRELMWLSENSKNEQLKALATSTFDAILGTGTMAKAPRNLSEPMPEEGQGSQTEKPR